MKVEQEHAKMQAQMGVDHDEQLRREREETTDMEQQVSLRFILLVINDLLSKYNLLWLFKQTTSRMLLYFSRDKHNNIFLHLG